MGESEKFGEIFIMVKIENRPRIALTLGDPAGVGPEITLKVLAKKEIYDICVPVVVGSRLVLEADLAAGGMSMQIRDITDASEALGQHGIIDVLETGTLSPNSFTKGKMSAAAGTFSGQCLEKAISMAMSKDVYAVVVPPTNKQALHEGGFDFPGFIETVNHMTGTEESIQILYGKKYKLARVTNHVSLREVPDLVTRKNVLKILKMVDKSLKSMGCERPRIGVSALNPHCGEDGLFGSEEIDSIIPAIEDARNEGIDALGPFPGDTVFLKMKEGHLDIVVSMYHDHGNGCMKLLEPGHMTNSVAGVPIRIFTVMHGTAFDIAGKGIADESNLEWSLHAAAGV